MVACYLAPCLTGLWRHYGGFPCLVMLLVGDSLGTQVYYVNQNNRDNQANLGFLTSHFRLQ